MNPEISSILVENLPPSYLPNTVLQNLLPILSLEKIYKLSKFF